MHDGRELDTLRSLQRLLDSAFRVPGTRFRFGWDPIVGLVPWAGDLITAAMGGAILWHARRLRVPPLVLLRMLVNIGVDLMIGVVPFIGDVADLFWKSNTRNMSLLERHAQRNGQSTPDEWIFLGVLGGVMLAMALLSLVVFYWVISFVARRGLF